jgi:hypothetical protein
MGFFAKIPFRIQCSINTRFSTFREEKLGFGKNPLKTGSAWRRVWMLWVG